MTPPDGLNIPQGAAPRLMDAFGRHISYLRLSVTDRCDLRCVYCMSEKMRFLPRADLLRLEELERLSSIFIGLGVRKIRLTGGEPLVRRDIGSLIKNLGNHVKSGALDELTLTTNATLLERHAATLAEAGIRRLNISLDTLEQENFSRLTRGGDLTKILRGIEAAKQAGLAIKINMVALKEDNQQEIPSLLRWAHEQNFDLTLIEIMPMGEVAEDRYDQYVPLMTVEDRLRQEFTLIEDPYKSGGPARYYKIAETGGRLGFISPLSQNFCAGCNRVRLTCTGRLYLCLGHDDHLDLRILLREGCRDQEIASHIIEALNRKPQAHDFTIDRAGQAPAQGRHMSATGG